MDNTILVGGGDSMYLAREVPVGCDETLLPNCAGRKKRAEAWTKMEESARSQRKQRGEKLLSLEEKKAQERKKFADKCDKQEWELTKERNDEMWEFFRKDKMMNGGAETTSQPGAGRRRLRYRSLNPGVGRRLLGDGQPAEGAGNENYATRECEGLPKPKNDANGQGTTEASPNQAENSVGRKKFHNPNEGILKRVQAAVAADLLHKGALVGSSFDKYGRDLKKLGVLPHHEERLSSEDRGERYERLAEEGRDTAHYHHYAEIAVNHHAPKQAREMAVSNNERRGQMMEYEAYGRSRSADGRTKHRPRDRYGDPYGRVDEDEHEHYRHYYHHYRPKRVRADGTPLLTEVGGGGTLDEYDNDDSEEVSVQKKEPKKKKEIHVDEGPGDGSDVLDDSQDKLDEQDGRDDYDQPMGREDNFDEDPDEETF